MLVIMLTIGVAAVVIWLVALPFRSRSRLVLGPVAETAKTDAAPAAALEVTT
jgi:spermidine/putrescine transport system permease protein